MTLTVNRDCVAVVAILGFAAKLVFGAAETLAIRIADNESGALDAVASGRDVPKVGHTCRVKFYRGRSGCPSRCFGGTACSDRARDRSDSCRPGKRCRGRGRSLQRVGTWKKQAPAPQRTNATKANKTIASSHSMGLSLASVLCRGNTQHWGPWRKESSATVLGASARVRAPDRCQSRN